MITTQKPVDIMGMVDETAAKKAHLLNKTCKAMKILKDKGWNNEAIEKTINYVNLPLDIHLTVTAHFTEICRYGRLLTKRERKLFNS